MAKGKKKVCYLVFEGRTIGLFETWAECDRSVSGYPGAKYKGYTDADEAFAVWERYEETGVVPVKM